MSSPLFMHQRVSVEDALKLDLTQNRIPMRLVQKLKPAYLLGSFLNGHDRALLFLIEGTVTARSPKGPLTI